MSLDIFQQTFSLAMMASLIVEEKGTLETLQKYYYTELTSKLQSLEGGQWGLAWGPTIWKLKPDEVTNVGNAGYIAFNPNAKFEDGSIHPTYIIAISGTPEGKYILEKEDNAVTSVVDFNSWVAGIDKETGILKEPVTVSSEVARKSPGTAYCSEGAAWGTHNLMNVESFNDSRYAASPGMRIIQYLRSLKPSQDTRFIVAGHSLGGALTTTISLALVAAQILPSASTITYPAAAWSAGNIAWAKQWAKTFPASKSEGAKSYQGWNLNLVNCLDCIPQLWCQVVTVSPRQWLGRIPSIYGIPIVSEVWTKFAVDFPATASTSGVVYKPVPSQYFDGPPPTSVPVTDVEFNAEMLIQHTLSYIHEVGIKLPEDQEKYLHMAQAQSLYALSV